MCILHNSLGYSNCSPSYTELHILLMISIPSRVLLEVFLNGELQ